MKTVAGAPVLAGCIPPPLPFHAPGHTPGHTDDGEGDEDDEDEDDEDEVTPPQHVSHNRSGIQYITAEDSGAHCNPAGCQTLTPLWAPHGKENTSQVGSYKTH